MEVGLDLTKIKIKKFTEFQVIQESISFDIEKAKLAAKNVGLDLTKEKSSLNKTDEASSKVQFIL